LADVEIVASYVVANLCVKKLERLIQRVFAAVQLNLTIDDRFGNPVKSREWLQMP